MASNNINIEASGPAGMQGKKFVTSVAAIIAACSIAAVCSPTLSAAYRRLIGRDRSPAPVLISREAKYQAFSGALRSHEIPWIFDGEQRKPGQILAVWPAASQRNAAACAGEWAKKSGYPVLCESLADQAVLAVQLDDIEPPLVAYVPVSRIAMVKVGQKVLIRMGHITGDGAVHSLPMYVRTLRHESEALF